VNPALRLHLRILEKPAVTVSTLVASCRSVFAQAGVTIDVASEDEILDLSQADQIKFTAVKVARSCSGTSVTSEQRDLFALASGLDARDIAVFMVDSTDRAVDGCAQHPSSRPGALVTRFCSKWTLAHELGHLLGLPHVPGPKTRLMFNAGAVAGLPVLVESEIATILRSRLLR
jgi:hypothetical protein